ncbi:GtrA-like protein [uncultured archaeon]|nr:GtrA-like protein [uncultured archaeon]
MASTKKQFILFCAVGGVGTIIDLSIFTILNQLLHIHYILSSILSFSVAVVNNYVLNKRWTFTDGTPYSKKQFVQFASISLLALVVRIPVLVILVEHFSVWEPAANFTAIIAATIVNFIGNKLWTFR